MSLKRVIHLVDGLQRVTLKNNSVSTIAKATYRTAFIGSASMCGYLFLLAIGHSSNRFYSGMLVIKKVLADYRGSYDIYNNVCAISLALIPCVKVPILKKYIMYPILLSVFDVVADVKNHFVI